jgi:hypothetical protein
MYNKFQMDRVFACEYIPSQILSIFFSREQPCPDFPQCEAFPRARATAKERDEIARTQDVLDRLTLSLIKH